MLTPRFTGRRGAFLDDCGGYSWDEEDVDMTRSRILFLPIVSSNRDVLHAREMTIPIGDSCY